MPSALSPLSHGSGNNHGLQHRQHRYPSPFLDIASTYLPKTVKSLFRFCQLYMYTNPLIAGTVRKKAQYPLTGLRYRHAERHVRDRWERFLEERLRIKSHLMEMSLDEQAYGNALASIYFPFIRMLVCGGCGAQNRIERAKFEWKDFHFRGRCERCKWVGNFGVRDVEYRYRNVEDPCRVRLVRWNPATIDIDYIHISGEHIYRYSIPPSLRMKIRRGHVETLAKYPLAFFDAVKSGSNRVRFDDGKIYHFKRAGISADDMGWGEPAILPTLKHLFVMSLFVKAREMLAHQHIVPLWVLFPQPIGNTDPIRGLDLGEWRRRVEREIQQWIHNPNYIPIMPIPLGSEFIGGNASKLSVVEDIKALESDILVALMVPPEFVYSGTWSGGSIAIRLLENEFISSQENQLLYLNRFLIPRLARHTGWSPVTASFGDLRLQDDVQRKNFNLALAQNGLVSKGLVVGDSNEDYEEQLEIIERERELEAKLAEKTLVGQTKAQGEAQIEQAKLQIRIQLMQERFAREVIQEMTEQGFDPNELEMIHQKILMKGGYNLSQDVPHGEGQNGNGGNGKGARPDRYDSPGFAGADDHYEYWKIQNMPKQVSAWAQEVMGAETVERDQILKQIRAKFPQLYEMIVQEINSQLAGQATKPGANGNGAGGQRSIDMRPMPEQKPPRRTT